MQVSVIDYLEHSAARFPDKPALQDQKEMFTYGQYLDTARRIGSGLSARTTPRHSVVVYMKKQACDLIAFMGIVYAGCHYTPLDNQMPLERVRMILDSLDPAVIIYDGSTKGNLEEMGLMDRAVTYQELAASEIDEARLEKVRSGQCQTDLLYILFTSGSTGVPKGVTISNLAMIDCIEWAVEVLRLDESLRACNQVPFYFDVSTLDIFTCMKTGGTLFIPPRTYYTFPTRVLQYLNDNEINFINWVPSALCNVVNTDALETCVPRYLKKVVFIGELMSCKHLNVWRRYVPDAEYVNAYGPTEATYACMYYIIDRDFTDDDIIPLGRACENSRIYLLDEDLKPVPDGELGEICVTGQCLSNGYFKAPEKTRESFIQNPLNTAWEEKMYKTGDLAYINEAGDMIFAGRKDSQIKRLGYRIELGEIENAILAIHGISNACCIYDQQNSDIIAIYTGTLTDEEILEILGDKIPGYMMPNRFVQLEEMPLNVNGKIDRPLLKKTYIG